MSLPVEYPDDFRHDGLDSTWFRGVPWSAQEAVAQMDPKFRVVRNPVFNTFVVVIKLSRADPQQVYPFAGSIKLVGWAPVLETERGQGAEVLPRVFEGMVRQERAFRENYGETMDSIEQGLVADKLEAENRRVQAMLQSTSFARTFGSNFLKTSLAMTVSNAKGGRLYAGAQREFRQELARREEATQGGKPFSLVRP